MSRWLESEDAEPAAAIAEDEPESLWDGPLGMTIRLSLFAMTIFGLYLGVQASSKPVTGLNDVGASVDIKPATRQTPSSTPAALPVVRIALAHPVQGPTLPRWMLLEPQAFCRLIDVDKDANKWRRSPVYPDEWECLSSRSLSAGTKTSSPMQQPSAGFNLFTMARGVGKTNVRHVRFKLSASDSTGIEAASEVVLDRLNALFKELKWPLPEHVSLAIRLQKPISIQEQGTTFQFVKERMSAFSYNLIITFPKPAKTVDRREKAKAQE